MNLLEDEENPQFYQRPKRNKFNYEYEPEIQEGPHYYHGYGPREDEYYSDSRETYSDSGENYSTEDYSYYSDENPKYLTSPAPKGKTKSKIEYSTTQDTSIKDSTTEDPTIGASTTEDSKTEDSTTKDTPVSGRKSHFPEKNVENWIPTNCSKTTRKSSDRYSTSFVNNTKDGLNEDTFPNPGEAEAVKRSSVFVGEDVTLCWIETITIKEDKSIQPPKKVVLREFTISFENSATIPEKYLECDKLEGELEPGCHDHVGKTGMFDVVDEDSKVSKMVNFTTVSNKGDIEVRQHKNVRCAVGPVVTKNVIEFKDGSKNPKKRVEVKVSPRLRKMSEAGESCSSGQEEIGKGQKIKPGVKDLPKDKKKGKEGRKPDEGDGIGKKLEERSGTLEEPSEEPGLIDKKAEEEITKKPTGDNDNEEDESKPVGASDGGPTTKKDEVAGSPEFPGVGNDREFTPNPDDDTTEKTPSVEETTQTNNHIDARKVFKSSNPTEESTTPKETEPKEDESVEPKSEYCEGDSCEQCSDEDCSTDSGSGEGSSEERSVTVEPGKETTPEIDDKNVKGVPTGRKSPNKKEPCSGEDCFQGTTTEKLPSEDRSRKVTLIPSDETGSTTKRPGTNQKLKDKSGSCEGGDCSPESEQASTEGIGTSTKPPSKDDKTDFGKATTESPSEQEKPSEEVASPEEVSPSATRKSSSRDVGPDLENESPAPGMDELDTKEPGHPTVKDSQRPEPESTSVRPFKNETDVPESWEKDTTKKPRRMLPHSLIHGKKPRKDLKCESGSCSTSLEGLTESPEEDRESKEGGSESPIRRTKPSDLSEQEGRPEFFEGTSKSPKNLTESPEDVSEYPEEPFESYGRTTNSAKGTKSKGRPKPSEPTESTEEFSEGTTKSPEGRSKSTKAPGKSSEFPEGTTKFPKSRSRSTEESSEFPDDVESPKDELKPKTTTEFPEKARKYSRSPTESGEVAEGTSTNFEETTPPLRSKIREERKRKKKLRKFEPDGHEVFTDTYSDEEDSSHRPYLKTTISAAEDHPRESEEIPINELKITTEKSQIERISQCSPDDEECISKSETRRTGPVSESEEVLEDRESKDQSTTTSNPKKELAKNIPVPESSKGKHRLGLRIKILLEHINENEEKKNLVEVDKHLLLNEDANDHDNNTILNQIKALNDSVTAQTIKALLNCSTLEKLSKNGISVKVDEATLVPKGKKGMKNLEPNELILSVEDKSPDDEGLAQLRRKRETNSNEDDSKDNNFKDDNSTDVNFTKENSTDANPTDTISTDEDTLDNNSTETTITTEANQIEVKDQNKNQTETVKDYLPDLKEDINTGVNHVLSKLNNCTTSSCFHEVANVNLLPISNILGIISDPKDSRTNSRNKRQTEAYRKEDAFQKLDQWSNERIKRATDGHHFRSLTEFTIFRKA